MSKTDQPNSPRHAPLKAQWQPGQKWETLVDGASVWVPVSDGGYREPTWDHNQEYRVAAVAPDRFAAAIPSERTTLEVGGASGVSLLCASPAQCQLNGGCIGTPGCSKAKPHGAEALCTQTVCPQREARRYGVTPGESPLRPAPGVTVLQAPSPTILDVGFKYENLVHTPTVLLGFRDWDARDAFVEALTAGVTAVQPRDSSALSRESDSIGKDDVTACPNFDAWVQSDPVARAHADNSRDLALIEHGWHGRGSRGVPEVAK